MDRKEPSYFFKWPQRQNICWVPFEHIFGILNPPNSSQCGRSYLFDNSNLLKFMSNLEKLVQK